MQQTFNVDDINFHPILKDVENIFWLFLLSHKALSHPDVQDLLKKEAKVQPDSISFVQMLEKFNRATDLQIEKGNKSSTSRMNILDSMIFTGKAMALLTYDYVLNSQYQDKITQYPPFIFLKFIRNASAHGNNFNLKDEDGEWKLGENEQVVWKEKIITRELHGRSAFNDFLTMMEMFLLAKDLSDELKNLDKK